MLWPPRLCHPSRVTQLSLEAREAHISARRRGYEHGLWGPRGPSHPDSISQRASGFLHSREPVSKTDALIHRTDRRMGSANGDGRDIEAVVPVLVKLSFRKERAHGIFRRSQDVCGQLLWDFPAVAQWSPSTYSLILGPLWECVRGRSWLIFSTSQSL